MKHITRTFLVFLMLSGVVSAPLSTEVKDYEDPAQSVASWSADPRHHVLLEALQGLLSRRFPSRDQASPTARLEVGGSSGALQKRGLGHCINDCLHSGGGLNFIQCKIMCY